VDYIWYDQEHSTMSPESLQNHILAAHGRGIAVIVRIQVRFSAPFLGLFRSISRLTRALSEQGPNAGYGAAGGGVTQPWGTISAKTALMTRFLYCFPLF